MLFQKCKIMLFSLFLVKKKKDSRIRPCLYVAELTRVEGSHV